jgi:hypothetical protein
MATVPDLSGATPYVDVHLTPPAKGIPYGTTYPTPPVVPGQATIYSTAGNGLRVMFPDGTSKLVNLT